jgi:hypothetical protein
MELIWIEYTHSSQPIAPYYSNGAEVKAAVQNLYFYLKKVKKNKVVG